MTEPTIDLPTDMRRVAKEMSNLSVRLAAIGTDEAWRHSVELAGASMMLRQWAEEVEQLPVDTAMAAL